MPDDERLGGTRDPYESGRRRRRSENPTPPPPTEQPRRRRRSVESGGVSVADLVQRHTGSRPDLTPVNPEQLRQNGVMTGRRARHDEPAAPPPPPPQPQPRQATAHPSIAAALDGADGFPPDRAAAQRGGQPGGDGFPRDEGGHRPGGASSYFTIPSDALRSIKDDPHAGESFDEGYPAAEEPPARRGRRAAEGPRPDAPRRNGSRRARPEPPDANGLRPGDNGFPPDAAPRRNGARRAGEGSGPRNGFLPDGGAPRNGAPRVGEGSGPRNGLLPADGFAPEADLPHPGRRPGGGNGPSNGFAPEADLPHPSRRPGEGSGPRNGFPPADNGFAPEVDLPRPGRRPGEGFAPRNGFPPVDNGFAPEADLPRRAGEASTHLPVPGDELPRPSRRGEPLPDGERPRPGRRGGEASTHLPSPGRRGETSARLTDGENGFPLDGAAPPRNGSRRAGEASARMPVANGFPPDDAPRPNRRVGEASVRMPIAEGFPPGRRAGDGPRNGFAPGEDPANGFPPDDVPRPNRRGGDASAHLPTDDFPPARRNGFAPGEDPANGFPPEDVPRPNRRVGEASVRMPIDPTDGGAPPRDRRGRRFPPGGRPGEGGLAEPGLPGDGGFPEPGSARPQGAARRRASRADAPRPDLGPHPNRFPADAPPQPGPESDAFPVDEFRRQGPHADEMPPVPDAPPQPKPRRSAGVPAVPPPPPPMGDDDLVTMTTEMEAIGNDEVQKRRSIDHTLARFSAVHDEIKAEEREKKAKRRKLRPWERDDEMDRLDELEAQQSMAMAIPKLDPRDDEDDEDEDPRRAKKKRRWRKGKNAGKAFAVFFAGLIFLSTAVGWGFKTYIDASAQQVDALDLGSDAIKDANAQLGDENFLLVGSDTRAGATAEDGVGDDQQVQGARSDTVMIAHVPKNRERVVVVSFPRDLEVTRPACEGWDPKTGKYTGDQHPESKRVKLNTAYQVGGPMCVTKLVQNLSGLAINHFVGIDFHGFKDMVDAVDGVEVCVERPMKDTVLGTVVEEAGKNVKLTGDQALNFVRARHVQGDKTSDYGRIIRQQRFLSSLLRKAMSGEVLLNPGKLTKFVDAFSKATFGDNIGVDQLFTLGQSMQGVAAGRVTFITVPTVGIANERGNEDLRTEDSNALFEAIRQDVPLPGEAPAKDDKSKTQTNAQRSGLTQSVPQAKGQPQGPVDPRGIKLQVLNGGNDTPRIAGDTADELADLGFEIMRVDSGPPTDKTVIRYSKSRAAQAQTLNAAVPGATLVEDPSVGGSIILLIGPDFDGKVVSPNGGGAPVDVPENLSTVNAGDVSCA